MAWRALALTAGLLVALGADAAPRAPKQNAEEQKKPDGKIDEYEPDFPKRMTWNLSDLNGKAPPAEVTLLIDENLRGSGTSGCNTWSASLYPVRGQKLAMGPVAQTKKACAADVMQFERVFLTILHSGPTWSQTGYTLTVKSQAGTLTFKRGL